MRELMQFLRVKCAETSFDSPVSSTGTGRPEVLSHGVSCQPKPHCRGMAEHNGSTKTTPATFPRIKRSTKPQLGDAYPLIMCQSANGAVYRPMLAQLFRLPRRGRSQFQSFDKRVAELTEISLGFKVRPRKSWKSDVLLSAQ